MLFKSEFDKYKTITTKRLILKILDADYALPLLNFVEGGRKSFEKYEAAKAAIFYTLPFQENILRNEYNASLNKTYLRYYIFEKDDASRIIGTVSFGNVLPEPYLSCNLGYKISPAYWGLGYCTEAVFAAMNTAYHYLNMHRINAFVQEDNIASIRVLEKSGFIAEGKCEKCIRINGKWTDHLLYANISPFLF